MPVTINGSGQTVVQVVTGILSTVASTTTTTRNGAATGLTATITPTSASNRILVCWNVIGNAGTTGAGYINLRRNNSTELAIGSGGTVNATGRFYGGSNTDALTQTQSGIFLDTPATTSATTYSFSFWTSVGTIFINRGQFSPDGGVVSSTITLMEISG